MNIIRRITISFLLTVVLSLLPIFTFVYADYAPVQSYAGGLTTHDNKGISLRKEELFISIHDREDCSKEANLYCGKYDVKTIFYFHNPNSEPVSLDTFFPVPDHKLGENVAIAMSMSKDDAPITEFKVDEYVYKSPTLANSYSSQSVFAEVVFNPGETKLEINYSQVLNPTGKFSFSKKNLEYVLTSGSLWVGPIGELIIVVDFQSEVTSQRYSLRSEEYYFEPISSSQIRYRGESIEPNTELNIDFLPSYVWEKVSALLSAEEYQVSFDQRRQIYGTLAPWLKIQNKLPIFDLKNEIVFDVFKRNAIILVEDMQADTENYEWYAEYWLDKLGVNIDSYNHKITRQCPTVNEHYHPSADEFERLRNIAMYNISTYLPNDMQQEYLQIIGDTIYPCNLHTDDQKSEGNNQNNTSNAASITPSAFLIYILLPISLTTNLILLRKAIRRASKKFPAYIKAKIYARKH